MTFRFVRALLVLGLLQGSTSCSLERARAARPSQPEVTPATSSSGDPGERWYQPVNIGIHVERRGVVEQALSAEQFGQLFADDGSRFTHRGLAQMSELRAQQLASRPSRADAANPDPSYHETTGPIEARVWTFSRSQVVIWVLVPTGYSRWHHFYDLVAAYRVGRSPPVDSFPSHELAMTVQDGIVMFIERGAPGWTKVPGAVRQ